MICMIKKEKYILLMFQHKSKREKQVILLENNLRRMARAYSRPKFLEYALMALSCSQKTISIIKRNKHLDDFYCLNCFHSFATENKLQSHKRVCERKDFCKIIMPVIFVKKNLKINI